MVEPLSLPARQTVSALTDNRVQAVGHLGDDVGQPRAFQGFPQFFVGRVRRRKHQVRPDRLVEQMAVLGDDSDGVLQ